MRKNFFLMVIGFCLAIGAGAQSTYGVGTNVVSAGIGLGSSLITGSYGSSTPGLSVQYERGMWEAGPGVISLGGYLGYKGYKYSDDYASWKWNYTIIGVRGAWHYTELNVDNLDLYGGLMLAYNHVSASYTVHDPNNPTVGGDGGHGSDVGLTAFVGGRYTISEPIAVFAELGYGVAYLNLGVAVKF